MTPRALSQLPSLSFINYSTLVQIETVFTWSSTLRVPVSTTTSDHGKSCTEISWSMKVVDRDV